MPLPMMEMERQMEVAAILSVCSLISLRLPSLNSLLFILNVLTFYYCLEQATLAALLWLLNLRFLLHFAK